MPLDASTRGYYRLRINAERRRKLFGSQTGSLEAGGDQPLSLAAAAYEAADGDPLRALTLVIDYRLHDPILRPSR